MALRAFPADGKRTRVILCSIDPTPEGLAAMQNFLASVYRSPNLSPDDEQLIVDGLRSNLGYQNIRIEGVRAEHPFRASAGRSRLPHEADRYRPGKAGRENRQLCGPGHPRTQRQSRCSAGISFPIINRCASRPMTWAWNWSGNGVKLVSEDQIVGADGSRQVSGKSNKASHDFVAGFHPQVRRAVAEGPGLRPIAQLHRSGRRRRIHPAARLLRQGRLADGDVRRRTSRSGRRRSTCPPRSRAS